MYRCIESSKVCNEVCTSLTDVRDYVVLGGIKSNLGLTQINIQMISTRSCNINNLKVSSKSVQIVLSYRVLSYYTSTLVYLLSA